MSARTKGVADREIVVIGAGHNGLAAAIMLAEAGRKVTVLESNAEPGGAVKTEEVTLPGFRHDLMATNLNLFMGSAFFAKYEDRLRSHGFDVAHSTRPVCSLFPNGGYIGVTSDLEETLKSIRAYSNIDADAFREMRAEFDRIAPHLFPLLGVPLPSAAAAKRLLTGSRALGRAWPLELGRLVAQSPRQFVEDHFESPEVQSLVAAWGMHLDFAPSVSGGALFPFLETMASQANGIVLGAGGAKTMIDAMTGLLGELGGQLQCDSKVDQVVIEDGKATAVVCADTRYEAGGGVVANLTPTQLFERLVDGDHLDKKFRTQVRRFRYGPGTLMVHLALSDLPPWIRTEAQQHTYVHIAPYLQDMDLAYSQAMAGILPQRPTLVVGQPTVADPSRAPAGKHVLWVQARMFPKIVSGDGAQEITGTSWEQIKEAVADRVMAQLEEYAPGLSSNVLGRHVLSPADLENSNANLVGGDSLAGSHHIMQNFALRPFPGWSRYRTPIKNLYMCGASTWPGAGLGAGSGYLVGNLLSSRRRR
ncbi:MAG: NAD(P)/FAD-dependent oxidoreductase [Acidimicrobiales bacterium]